MGCVVLSFVYGVFHPSGATCFVYGLTRHACASVVGKSECPPPPHTPLVLTFEYFRGAVRVPLRPPSPSGPRVPAGVILQSLSRRCALARRDRERERLGPVPPRLLKCPVGTDGWVPVAGGGLLYRPSRTCPNVSVLFITKRSDGPSWAQTEALLGRAVVFQQLAVRARGGGGSLLLELDESPPHILDIRLRSHTRI